LEYFFLQEWLGEKNPRVVSVCGFHDSNDNSRNLVAIVERIASHSAGLSCSAAVQTIHDEWLLIEKTKKILNSLQFVGPYELEYLVVGSDTFVLELNPRFWMQHAIFLLRGNGLIKRYLGRETEEDKKNSQVDDVVWVDSIHLLISIARLNFSLLALVFKKYFEPGRHILLWPSIPMAMYVVTRMVYEKIRARFKNEINKLR
jgi:predicted ATP-grasp superfamily ATP-dependent carboligase